MKKAEQIRRNLKKHFKSEKHMLSMGHDQKRKLLHALFDGSDQTGTSYGIYASKVKGGLDYLIYGKAVMTACSTQSEMDYNDEQDIKDNSNIVELNEYKTSKKSVVAFKDLFIR